jgi:tripeptide aminopeptidase
MGKRKSASRRNKSPSKNLTPETRRARALLLDLLEVPGVSGREGEVMDWIAARLRKAGAPTNAMHKDQAQRRSPHNGTVGNMALVLPGTLKGPRRMLSAHVDTVPLCEGARPVVKGDSIVPADKETALGADDRCGVAVVLGAALEILENKLPHPPVTFLFTIQEEVGLFGARHVKLGMLGRPRLAFNFDGGSSEKLTVGATGGYRMEIRVEGLASHAGNAPEEGVSAVAITSLAIARLQEKGWHGLVQKGVKRGTSNFGVIQGGQATNVVTPLVEVRAEARSHDPVFRKQIVDAIEKEFHKAAREVKSVDGQCGKALIDGRLDYEAFLLKDDEPCVAVAEEAIRSEGGKPIRAACNGGLDANWLSVRGIPTVTLGCGQVNPHTVAERVCLPEFDRGAGIALRLATGRESDAR